MLSRRFPYFLDPLHSQLLWWNLEWSSQRLDTQTDTVPQISFVASVMMSGRTLECVGNGQGVTTFGKVLDIFL